MELIPFYDFETNRIVNGDIVTSFTWCNKHYNEKCKAHYLSINREGFYICPYGFTTYCKKIGQVFVLYTSILVSKNYEKKLVNPKISGEEIVNKFSEMKFLEIVKCSIEYNDKNYQHIEEVELLKIKIDNLVDENDNFRKFVFDTFHEIRSLNNTLSSQSDNVLSISRKYLDNENDFFKNSIHSILATSGLISSRLASLDILINSSVLETSIQKNANIYGKLYKCKQILSTFFSSYQVGINLNGESYSESRINDLFEICPYLIFENYLKYSPEGTMIDVNITEDNDYINITITNEGPMHTREELTNVFKLHYRSKTVKHIKGNGIGLYIVKMIFDYLGFQISVESSVIKARTINKISYSQFTTYIKIPITVKHMKPL